MGRMRAALANKAGKSSWVKALFERTSPDPEKFSEEELELLRLQEAKAIWDTVSPYVHSQYYRFLTTGEAPLLTGALSREETVRFLNCLDDERRRVAFVRRYHLTR